MIDIRRLRFDGKFNYQNGLRFYFKRNGHVVSFLVQEIGDRKRKIKVTMLPDPNHDRAHVHIGEHGASFAVDTGELLAGECDNRTRQSVQKWIHDHKEDLLELWKIVKAGGDYHPRVRRIRDDMGFDDYGFNGEKPEKYMNVDGVKIWYDGELIQEIDASNVRHIVAESDMYVGLQEGFLKGSMTFESVNGRVMIKYGGNNGSWFTNNDIRL